MTKSTPAIAKAVKAIGDGFAEVFKSVHNDPRDRFVSRRNKKAGRKRRAAMKSPRDAASKPRTRKDSPFTLAKIDQEERLVFGFFSIVEEGGELVVDRDDEVIETDTLEKAAYNFVLDARVAGESHNRMNIGDLVESMVFTPEKQEAIVKSLESQGINAVMDLGVVAWWGGFHITDDEVWDRISKGDDLVAFSIGGTATVEPMDGDSP